MSGEVVFPGEGYPTCYEFRLLPELARTVDLLRPGFPEAVQGEDGGANIAADAGLAQQVEHLTAGKSHPMSSSANPGASIDLQSVFAGGGTRDEHSDARVISRTGALGEHGLELLIEPINTRDIPGYFLNTQAEAHAVREEVGAANLKVQMDFYHVQIVEGDCNEVPQVLRTCQSHSGRQRSGTERTGRGEVNYRYLFRLVDELGYGGWIGCE